MHCFSGGPAEAQRSMELGFHISFSGIVTYPKAVEVHEAAKLVPRERLLVETDAPYLAPVPHRGKRNEPAFAACTAECVAALRGEAVNEICAAVGANFRRLMKLG
jgi:TatD DNase family protein